jgi:hypothetical protein
MYIIDKLKRLEEKWREKERERAKSHSKELKPGESRSLKFPGKKLLNLIIIDRMKREMKADDEYKRLLKVMNRDPNFC